MTSYNLVWVFIMIVWISVVILVAMVTIFAGKYGLPNYQHIYNGKVPFVGYSYSDHLYVNITARSSAF